MTRKGAKMTDSLEVVHMRLCNGDEIIGELSGSSNTEYLIMRPMMVSEVTDDKTHISTIILSKYILFDENQVIPFNRSHVITQTRILDEIKSYYYNSIQYNTKFVEPIVRQELVKVNLIMEGILKQTASMENVVIRRSNRYNEDEEPISQDIKIVVPGSNTVN